VLKSRGGRRGGTKPSSSTINKSSNSNNNDITNTLDDTETSFSTISTLTESAPPAEGTERREVLDAAEMELREARNRRQQQVDGAEQELQEARNRRNQTAMNLRIATLENNLEIAKNDRREHERTKRQKMALELEVAQANEELASKKEILLSKEMELVNLTKRLSDLHNVMDKTATTRFRQPEILSKALDEKNKELAEQYNAEKRAKDDAGRRCLELELQLKASNDKRKELAKQHMSDQNARENVEARCLELESRLKASNETNQELAALLRQKTSRIQSMDESLDETEELREKALEYDYVVCLCDQLEKKVLVTILANEELMEEKESLTREIAELNTSVFDAELEREVQTEELKSAQNRVESLTTQCLSFEAELNGLKQTNLTITEENKTLAAKMSELNSSTEATNEFQSVRKENESLANRCESLESALNSLEDRNQTVMEEKQLLTKNITELNSSIVRAEQQRKAQTMQLQHVQNQNRSLAGRCKSLETDINNACSVDKKSEREGNTDELQTLQKQNELLASRCKKLETELNNMEEEKRTEQKKVHLRTMNSINQYVPTTKRE
jgi:chromosome segregation ATPase